MRIAVVALLIGCTAKPASQPTTKPPVEDPQKREAQRRAELAAAHRALLDEQATALAATCDPGQPSRPRCLPSCYTPEAADPREGKPPARGVAEVMHLVCRRGDEGPYMLADEIDSTLALRAVRGRMPSANKPGSWQADVEAAVTAALEPEITRGDVVRVTGAWKPNAHPRTREPLQCVSVSHYVRSQRKKLDRCGSQGAIACEAAGNSAAHGINVVHYRLLEARRLQADGKSTDCQQAALEAIAVARGMPRWRQYMTLNTARWKAARRYRTRFDGTLDEDTLFSTAIDLGKEAETVYAACGGATPKTEATQEQSFHTCW